MGPSLDSVFMVMEYADHDLKAGGWGHQCTASPAGCLLHARSAGTSAAALRACRSAYAACMCWWNCSSLILGFRSYSERSRNSVLLLGVRHAPAKHATPCFGPTPPTLPQ